MPIARPNHIALATPQVEEAPKLTDSQYRHAVVDSQYTPSNSLLTHLPGMKWSVDYYHQVLGRDEEPSPFDPTQSSPYQQYRRIVKYEILLQGSLSDDIDPETAVTTTTGNAIIYPGLVPIQGDAFIMDAGDGRACQCTVTSIRRLSMFRDTAYELVFQISRYMDQVIEDEINSRVVKTVYFHKDFLQYGQNPFLIQEDHEATKNIAKYMDNLIEYWTQRYWVPAFNTFLVPSQWGHCYDPYFMDFIVDLLPLQDHNEYRNMRLINCNDFNLTRQIPVWTMLFKRDPFILNTMFKQSGLLSAKAFSNAPLYNGVFYSGVDNVVAPKIVDHGYGINDHDYSTSYGWSMCSCTCGGGESEGLGFKSDETLADGTVGMDLPILFKDDYYVFTAAFYAGDEANMSAFERLLWRLTNGEPVNSVELVPFYKSINRWSKLDQFYLIPTLILLMKYSLRSI